MKAQHTLLVVDDDATMRTMLGKALVRLGYEIQECSDGVEAFSALEALRGHALLVLDYEMPKFNGAQVCEIIRTHPDPEIAQAPIILLTGHTGESPEIECLKAGADDFVTKPVNLPVLRARIETHLRLAYLRSELVEQNRLAEEWRTLHERDLEAARLVQYAIIPQKMPPWEGWEFAAHHQSLIQVGGDVYDWLPLANGRCIFWMADATGHGASAALLTTFIKLLFRYAVAETQEPDEVLRHVNHEFRTIFKGNLFMTAACLLLDSQTGVMHSAAAGHPPLLLLRRDGSLESIPSSAPPIGLVLEEGLPERVESELAPGDTVLLYSDGLYSVTDANGVHLPFPKFLLMMEGVAPRPAGQVITESIDRALAFAANGAFDDDLAVVAITRGPSGSTPA